VKPVMPLHLLASSSMSGALSPRSHTRSWDCVLGEGLEQLHTCSVERKCDCVKQVCAECSICVQCTASRFSSHEF
jgi:hypothetical protein